MNSQFSVYDPNTGEILWTGNASEIYTQAPNGLEVYPDIIDANELYIVDEIPVPRPSMDLLMDKASIPANGVSVSRITGVPPNTKVSIKNGSFVIVDDGVLDFTADMPGRYILRFVNFPYKPAEIVIDAT